MANTLELKLRARCPELFRSEAIEMAEEAILFPLHLERARAQSQNIRKYPFYLFNGQNDFKQENHDLQGGSDLFWKK